VRRAPLLLLTTLACAREAPPPPPPSPAQAELPSRPEVVKVTDGVYVALGFGLANSVLLEGPDGVVIVDTLGQNRSAAAAMAAFRAHTDKPVKAVILTHNHADHVFGTQAVLQGTSGVPIYAHASLGAQLDRVMGVVRPIIYQRSMRMFGVFLPEGEHEGCGIGPALDHDAADAGLLRPTHTFTDRVQLQVAGLALELVHAPGETDDQLFVWYPEKQVLLPADNFYQAFPNLYTLRGTPHRDVRRWVSSLDAMRTLAPTHLVPSHTRPISGSQAVLQALTDYRDAIQYVHDQTVRGMNRGLTGRGLVDFVRLPAHLAERPYLAERYGAVGWSVRAIYHGYLGWFDGEATHLDPLATAARAERWARLLPAGTSLAGAAQAALTQGDLQWAAELAELAAARDPGDREVRATWAAALRGLAERQTSANGRNYYLTEARERAGELEIGQPELTRLSAPFLSALPVAGFIEAMPSHLKAEEALEVELAAGFRFTDVGQDLTVRIRRGVAEVQPGLASDRAFTLTTTAEVYKRVVVGQDNPAAAVAAGRLSLEEGSDLTAALRFLSLFERP
jgi:alkyl sulfatase BDS1-like metallo-beta-lactamase superfamily hydrolase